MKWIFSPFLGMKINKESINFFSIGHPTCRMGRVRTLNFTCIPSLDFLTLDSHYSYSSSIASWMNGRGGGCRVFSYACFIQHIYCAVLLHQAKDFTLRKSSRGKQLWISSGLVTNLKIALKILFAIVNTKYNLTSSEYRCVESFLHHYLGHSSYSLWQNMHAFHGAK